MKHLITTLSFLISVASFASTDTVYVQTVNGIGQSKTLTIVIYEPQAIKETIGYKEFIEERGVELSDTSYKDFVRQEIKLKLISLKYRVKSSASLDYPDGAIGSLITTDDKKLFIKFPFYAQNGYGARVLSEAIILGDNLIIK